MKLKLVSKLHQAVALPAGGGVKTGAIGSNGGSLGIQTPSAARNSAAAPLEHDGSGSEDEWEPGAYGLIDAPQKPRGFGGSRPAASGRQGQQQQRGQQTQPGRACLAPQGPFHTPPWAPAAPAPACPSRSLRGSLASAGPPHSHFPLPSRSSWQAALPPPRASRQAAPPPPRASCPANSVCSAAAAAVHPA